MHGLPFASSIGQRISLSEIVPQTFKRWFEGNLKEVPLSGLGRIFLVNSQLRAEYLQRRYIQSRDLVAEEEDVGMTLACFPAFELVVRHRVWREDNVARGVMWSPSEWEGGELLQLGRRRGQPEAGGAEVQPTG